MMYKGVRLRAAQGRASAARMREPTSPSSATARLRAAGASPPTTGVPLRQLAHGRQEKARLWAAAVRLRPLAYGQPDRQSSPTGGCTTSCRLAYGRQHLAARLRAAAVRLRLLAYGRLVARLRAATESCKARRFAAHHVGSKCAYHISFILVFGCQEFLPELPQLFIYSVYVYRFIYLFHRVPTVPEAIYIYYQPLTDIFPPMAGHRTLIVAGE